MNDFYADVAAKKRIARGDMHRKRGSKSRKCTLPFELLTAKERKELNGQVFTYKLNQPMTKDEFRLMPTDLQREYLNNLFKAHGATTKQVEEMLGVSSSALYRWMNTLGVRVGRHRGSSTKDETEALRNAWNRFIYGADGVNPVSEVTEEPVDSVDLDTEVTDEIVESISEEDLEITEDGVEATHSSGIAVNKAHFQFRGSLRDVCNQICNLVSVMDDFECRVNLAIDAVDPFEM